MTNEFTPEDNPQTQAGVTLRGIWAGADITDQDIEAVTHPERRIRALEAENEALRREIQRLQDLSSPTLRPQG
jgi:cell division protein FtsB